MSFDQQNLNLKSVFIGRSENPDNPEKSDIVIINSFRQVGKQVKPGLLDGREQDK